MNTPIHYLPGLLRRMFHRHDNAIECKSLHQVASGWAGVLKCGITGRDYVVTIMPVAEETVLMYSDVIKTNNHP